jgi:hypothetical protein
MQKQSWRFIVAGLLILFGAAILLNNLHVLPWDVTSMQWFWLIFFGGGGVAFIGVYLTNRGNWWAIIPGFTLLGLAILVSDIIQGEAGAAVFLGSIGLSFWVIYLQRRDFWWAIIPGGVMISLAAMIAFSPLMDGTGEPALLFIGMGITFFLVYLLIGPEQKRMTWALWPAAVLGIMGLLFTLGSSGLLAYLFPVAMILFGGWMVLRAVNRRNQIL